MNSSAASICYVASTHTVFPGLITHQTAETNAPSETPDDSARPVRPGPSADAPEPSEPPPDDSRNTPSHRETAASGSRDYARRSWHDNASFGTIQPTAAEIAAPHTMKTILATSTMKADLVLDIRPTTPNLVGELFTLEEHRNKYRLFYVSDTVSLVARPDHFGVTMLLPTFGIAATSSSKGL